ncbi:ABC transporter permease [Peribacillus simplex]|uniref:ABC transporter permease n=2 Tax=Peribacillus TaxID=2675229 RepID=A0AA90P962_9BACI|nr:MULTISPECIES: ABC transporter permease [Peribacillus]MDP1418437.1 ABC transporter permease [Peribacillus simplex]MDP1451188.1 ABC transporter permease [Peribacillus frigoritolerans]
MRASAFRANKNTPQLYEAAVNPSVKVLYQTEQFDLANEYNPHISTFIPTEDGVYEITAKVSFCPSKSKSDNSSKNNNDNCNCDYCKITHSSKEGYVASISINVNGDDLDTDIDFFEKSSPIGLSVTTILQLQAGDRVQVIFSAGANGVILAEAPLTNFQAARFPSPM